MTQKDLRYGDNCTRCRAASGIDTCPNGGGKDCPLTVKVLPANYYEPRPPAGGHAQAHRAQLAKWCELHKRPAPSGPVVDAFVAAMKANQYGVEETWDAFAWFRHGWESVTLVPAGWRYRYGASGWRYVAKESDCNPGEGYEREPVFTAKTRLN